MAVLEHENTFGLETSEIVLVFSVSAQFIQLNHAWMLQFALLQLHNPEGTISVLCYIKISQRVYLQACYI